MADIKTVKVDKYNKDLRGCVSINRNSYPVKGTILDELVEVEVINGKNKTANLRKVVKPSKYRVKPLCPIYQKCGGCSLLHIDYHCGHVFKHVLETKVDSRNTEVGVVTVAARIADCA